MRILVMMIEDEFYALEFPESTRLLAKWVDDEMDLEAIICPVDPGHQRPGKRLTDLSISLPSGEMKDFVWTWYSECIIQDKMLKLLQENGFSGFSVKPVKPAFKEKNIKILPKLWEIIVTGWAGLAAPESGIRLLEECKACGALCYSAYTDPQLLINKDQWDGSDVFMVWPLPRFIFISRRLAQFLKKMRASGIVIKKLQDIPISEMYPYLAPGRLSYYMSESRAKDLGESLGIF
jgi:hypothetical protein